MRDKGKIRVAVIGAGPSGLIASRFLSNHPRFEHDVYERGNCVGGLWVYTDRTGVDEDGHPVHSSIYRNMRTNRTKQMMEFPDFKFPDDAPSFLSHVHVHEYLEAYADRYRLRENIRLRHVVTSVSRLDSSDDPQRPRWSLTARDTATSAEQTRLYDAVLVCSGHCSAPYFSPVTNIDAFRGDVLHSHDYRRPEPYAGKTVVILGAGASSLDIALDISRVATRVIVSIGGLDTFELRRQHADGKLPPNLSVARWPQHVGETTVRFADGETADVDAILFCTGYTYSYPFLDESCGVAIDNGKRVRPLYKHMINTKHQTMIFINVIFIPIQFIVAYAQVPVALSILDGSLQLPSEKLMNEETEREYERRRLAGQNPGYAHRWECERFSGEHYYADLIEYPKFGDTTYKELMAKAKKIDVKITNNICNYRDFDYT